MYLEPQFLLMAGTWANYVASRFQFLHLFAYLFEDPSISYHAMILIQHFLS